MDTDPDQWLRDKISESFIQLHRLDEVLYEGRTPYQSARIVRARNLGTCLVLDGKIQSSEVDEHIYHEALVHPALLAHPHPKSVFIAGGGEGATLREVLRHPTVKRAVMVEIDETVTQISRQHLPDLSRGAVEDRRTELHHTDARAYLEKNKDKYDVIIIDLPDPIEEGPAYLLFTGNFIKSSSTAHRRRTYRRPGRFRLADGAAEPDRRRADAANRLPGGSALRRLRTLLRGAVGLLPGLAGQRPVAFLPRRGRPAAGRPVARRHALLRRHHPPQHVLPARLHPAGPGRAEADHHG